MLTFVVYSHTDFLDILKVQTHYLQSHANKTLLINNTDIDISEISSYYERIIFYDDTLPYASRLCELNILQDEYIVLTHDIDVIVNCDIIELDKLCSVMRDNNLDRIDLKYYDLELEDEIKVESAYTYQLVPSTGRYRYNVNASIWKVSSLLETMKRFSQHSYRQIEGNDVQEFCKKYEIFTLTAPSYINSGHFGCIPFFQYIHITHGGKLLGKTTSNTDVGPYQNLHPTLQPVYQAILDDFNLLSTRQLDTRYYGPDYYHGKMKEINE
jgi:hypothetical protein